MAVAPSVLHDECLKAHQQVLQLGLTVNYRHCPPTRMALTSLSTSIPSNSSGQLTREQIDALLQELREPSRARQFLMDAGLIDVDGQLTPPYRSEDGQTA